MFGFFRESLARSRRFYYSPWWDGFSSRSWHQCMVCRHWLSDEHGGMIMDYNCPCGNYECHFDCGGFRLRVGKQWVEFRDECDNPSAAAYGFAKVQELCKRLLKGETMKGEEPIQPGIWTFDKEPEKKLNFVISGGDGMMEARTDKTFYVIYQLGDSMKATAYGEDLVSGTIYECLDACNKHWAKNGFQ